MRKGNPTSIFERTLIFRRREEQFYQLLKITHNKLRRLVEIKFCPSLIIESEVSRIIPANCG